MGSNLYSQFLPLSRFCNSVLPPLPNLEHLYIHSSFLLRRFDHFAETTQWLELLHRFTSVKNLHLSERVALRVVGALQDLSTSDEGVTRSG